ncbi:methyltransferase domain-containing protein [Pedobacter gandavensis]|uniref:methyltransferase domain-containing protein n=1 Tax=Pedobacter gandavensis TaxID=2679963 RepID=UPI002931BBA4|nr:methyltransferase domain-containing protein [Pedobacter gandavensis]
MEQVRKPFQGIWNIIRFNWHFYLLSMGLIFLLMLLALIQPAFQGLLYIAAFGMLAIIVISLSVSWYVYDLSGLYSFNWLNPSSTEDRIVTINAGFDETTAILGRKFPKGEILVLDFYDPLKHTEVSIKRARKAYPAFPGTQQVSTKKIELEDHSIDKIFLILSAHEIREEKERIVFFKELNRVLSSNGQIFIVEHLRDLPNFLAYNIGFFHFHSKATWFKTFDEAKLLIQQELKLTPFISTFILEKNGDTL